MRSEKRPIAGMADSYRDTFAATVNTLYTYPRLQVSQVHPNVA